jgi:acetaldehyde dehydrogenase/alcohol dehydrogenase
MGEVSNLVNETLSRAVLSAAIFSQLNQEQTDKIVSAVYEAGMNNRVRLAKMAAEETGMGKWEDKVLKNVVSTQYVYESVRNQKTAGIISEDFESGISEVAQPIGPILAIIPCTNPTSTVMFKVLIALKTRNPIIISAHHRALECCREAVRICYEAALEADAPEDCIIFFERGSREDTKNLMCDKRLSLILATGGEGVVKAAYSSGTPALGVGAGNVPVYIEESADIPFAAEQILISKTFDNGTICASEQSIVVERKVSDQLKKELQAKGAYFLSEEEKAAVEKIAFDPEKHTMTAEVVGQSAKKVAELAGVNVPDETTLLVGSMENVGYDYPLSCEILAPAIGFYVVDSFDDAIKLCIDLNFHGGIGHTVSIYSNDEEKIKQFGMTMNAGRVLVNTPSSQGAVGGMFNKLLPSLTLGCGTGGKNITTDNVSAKHLLNIQRIARRRANERMEHFDSSLYYDESISAREIERIFNINH